MCTRVLDRRERIRIKHVPLTAPTPVWDPFTQQLVIRTYREDRQRVAEYFVKWRGLAYTNASWEDEAWVLENASEKIDIFRYENDEPLLRGDEHGLHSDYRAVRRRCEPEGQRRPPSRAEVSWGNYLCQGGKNMTIQPESLGPRRQNSRSRDKVSSGTAENPAGHMMSALPISSWGAYLCRGNGCGVASCRIQTSPGRGDKMGARPQRDRIDDHAQRYAMMRKCMLPLSCSGLADVRMLLRNACVA